MTSHEQEADSVVTEMALYRVIRILLPKEWAQLELGIRAKVPRFQEDQTLLVLYK